MVWYVEYIRVAYYFQYVENLRVGAQGRGKGSSSHFTRQEMHAGRLSLTFCYETQL